MKKNPLLGKHSHNNRESLEGTAMRLLREYKKLSFVDVALKMNMKAAVVDHFENGRKFYTTEDIAKFLECYDFSPEDFGQLLKLRPLNRTIANHFFMGLG